MTNSLNRYLRLPEILKITSLSPSIIWRMEKKSIFPKRRQLSQKRVGWLESEIKIWLADRNITK